MRIDYISTVIPFTGLVQYLDPNYLEIKRRSEYYILEKYRKAAEEERISVSPIYNCHGKIVKNIGEKSLDLFA